MSQFDEPLFLHALMARPEFVRQFSTVFLPDWLDDPTLIPILQEIYDFTKKHGVPPDVPTLERIFKDRDASMFELRFRNALVAIRSSAPTAAEMIYTLDRARSVAMARSLMKLVTHTDFLSLATDNDGESMMKLMHQCLSQFSENTDESSLHIKDALDLLIQEQGDMVTRDPIPCGIKPMDMWSQGGIRPPDVGIIMAPTGHGKSATLLNIAWHIAAMQELPVWFVTNELDMREQAERFFSRITSVDMYDIARKPAAAYEKLDRHWLYGLNENLLLTAVNRDLSCDDLEAMMGRWYNLYGWKPKVIVVDFMERMKPNDMTYGREEWTRLGAIGRDMVRMAKRHRMLIWTACQTNRLGLSANTMLPEYAQGSVRHFQEIAMVVGMRQAVSLGGLDALQFNLIKWRHGSKRGTAPIAVEADLTKMYISNQLTKLAAPIDDEEEDEDPPKAKKYTKRKSKSSKRDDIEMPTIGS